MHESFNRHEPEKKAQQLLQNVSLPIVCENCGNVLSTRANAYNVMFTCTIGSPGHPALPPFQCDSVEHWTCSTECWRNVAHACIDQHMSATLEALLQQLEERKQEYGNGINKI
jgi:hypothetical protein